MTRRSLSTFLLLDIAPILATAGVGIGALAAFQAGLVFLGNLLTVLCLCLFVLIILRL